MYSKRFRLKLGHWYAMSSVVGATLFDDLGMIDVCSVSLIYHLG